MNLPKEKAENKYSRKRQTQGTPRACPWGQYTSKHSNVPPQTYYVLLTSLCCHISNPSVIKKQKPYSSGYKSQFHVSAIDNMTAKDFLPTSVVHYKTQAELKTIDSYPMMCDFKIMFQNIFFSLSWLNHLQLAILFLFLCEFSVLPQTGSFLTRGCLRGETIW